MAAAEQRNSLALTVEEVQRLAALSANVMHELAANPPPTPPHTPRGADGEALCMEVLSLDDKGAALVESGPRHSGALTLLKDLSPPRPQKYSSLPLDTKPKHSTLYVMVTSFVQYVLHDTVLKTIRRYPCMSFLVASLAIVASWELLVVFASPPIVDVQPGLLVDGEWEPSPLTPPPMPSAASEWCSNKCEYANDNTCDDGGPGSEYTLCASATDCVDCGVRSAIVTQLRAPPSAPAATRTSPTTTSSSSSTPSVAPPPHSASRGGGATAASSPSSSPSSTSPATTPPHPSPPPPPPPPQ